MDSFWAAGVVERDAHAAYGAVAGRADQACGFGFFREFLFFGFVAAGYTEDYVHFRARRFFDRAGVVAAAAVDRVVEQLRFCVVALFDSGDAAFAGNPIHHQADHVDSEGRRRVIERLFLDVRAVLQEGRQIFIGALGKIFAHDDDGGAAGTKIFLRAREDAAEFFHVDRTRSDVGRHISDERSIADVWNRVPLRAFDRVVGADV